MLSRRRLLQLAAAAPFSRSLARAAEPAPFRLYSPQAPELSLWAACGRVELFRSYLATRGGVGRKIGWQYFTRPFLTLEALRDADSGRPAPVFDVTWPDHWRKYGDEWVLLSPMEAASTWRIRLEGLSGGEEAARTCLAACARDNESNRMILELDAAAGRTLELYRIRVDGPATDALRPGALQRLAACELLVYEVDWWPIAESRRPVVRDHKGAAAQATSPL